jgi:predicted nucleotide-binding protein
MRVKNDVAHAREDKQRKVTLLRERIDEAQDGEPADFNGWNARSESALRIALGRDHPIVEQFHGIRYSLAVWSDSTPASAWRDAQRSGIRQGIALLEGAVLEVEHGSATNGDDSTAVASTGGVVFVVHGHDEARKQMAVRAVEQMTGEPPIVLHEQPDRGRTIIEKLEDHAATASFAIVLLTGDDKGASKNATRMTPRARQNVVFEAGLFVGLLGRERVVLLYEQDVELPSDLHGVLFKEIDAGGAWRYGLGREMRAAGLLADLNDLR